MPSPKWEGHLYQHTGPVAAYRMLSDRHVRVTSGGTKRVVAVVASPRLPDGASVSLDGESLRVTATLELKSASAGTFLTALEPP